MMDVLHAGLGWPVAVTLLVVSFTTSFITISFGIGGGVIMLAVLASLLPAAAIVPVHGLVQLGSNAGRAAVMRRYMRLDLLGPFAIGALIGIALGGSVVVQLEAGWIQLGVGLFILWSVVSRPPAFLRRSGMITGFISSFLTMFFGATGMFVATFSKSLSLGRHSHVATHATLMLVQHLFKSVTFAFLGFAFLPWLVFIILMILAGVLGTLVGNVALKHMTDARFHRALDIVLGLIALRLVWSGLRSAFGE